MDNTFTHWTEQSTADFLFRIGSDFVAQIEAKMESLPMRQIELAEKLGVTKGRVSQIFNNPGNLTLGMIIKCARAVGMKASVIAYDDGDKENKRGPVHSEIFKMCWEYAGRPADIWSIKKPVQFSAVFISSDAPWLCQFQPGVSRLLPQTTEGGFNEANILWPEEAPPDRFAFNSSLVFAPCPSGGMLIPTD